MILRGWKLITLPGRHRSQGQCRQCRSRSRSRARPAGGSTTAVQTLSRLNRTHRAAGGEQKRKTFVIDFANKPEDVRTAFEPYFTSATLETETDPYVVVHLAAKLAQAGIYTEDQVREVARLWVERKGNNALSAAITPAKHDFARRYAAALEAESFTRSQIQEFVNGLVQRLLAYPDLVRLTKVNTKKQFMDLSEFQTMLTEAVADNQDAHNTMADYFFSDGPASTSSSPPSPMRSMRQRLTS